MEFKCVLCLPEVMYDASLVVRHEDYLDRRGDEPGGGGVRVPAPAGPTPAGGPGGAVFVPEFHGRADFERQQPRLAQSTREHRLAAQEVLRELLGRIFVPDQRRQDIEGVALTSAPAVLGELETTGIEVSQELQDAVDAGGLDEELLADALGVAAWAVGAPPRFGDREVPLARIQLIGSQRVQFLLRYAQLMRAIA